MQPSFATPFPAPPLVLLGDTEPLNRCETTPRQLPSRAHPPRLLAYASGFHVSPRQPTRPPPRGVTGRLEQLRAASELQEAARARGEAALLRPSKPAARPVHPSESPRRSACPSNHDRRSTSALSSRARRSASRCHSSLRRMRRSVRCWNSRVSCRRRRADSFRGAGFVSRSGEVAGDWRSAASLPRASPLGASSEAGGGPLGLGGIAVTVTVVAWHRGCGWNEHGRGDQEGHVAAPPDTCEALAAGAGTARGGTTCTGTGTTAVAEVLGTQTTDGAGLLPPHCRGVPVQDEGGLGTPPRLTLTTGQPELHLLTVEICRTTAGPQCQACELICWG